ncbi:MAG: SpoIVB peptidase S55 domain-containing protein [Verrucomicrobium sp.]|nr:SpoIVB peptidase S55 domain-containing protein [Verrucomicrobium sp.]
MRRRRLLLLAALLCLTAGGLRAQESPPAAASILPVKEIRPGMRGVAYTVLQGTEVVPIQVEIMGVAENAMGPGLDLIIGKLVDPKTAVCGAVHGMSGSPLYIDGKLAGALSRRLTTFEKDAQCGFTPIESMLQVGEMASSASAMAAPFSPFHLAKGDTLVEPPAPRFETLGVPFSATGLSGQALGELWRALGFSGSGFIPVSAGGSGSLARLSGAELKPGGAVSAVLMSGDLNVVGTGTVTTRTGNRLLAFGHGMQEAGASAWGLAPAEIITTIPSYAEAFKMSNAGPLVGTVDQDRLCAIAGKVGPLPPLADYRIEIVHNGKASPTLKGRFVTDKNTVPLLVATAAAAAMQDSNRVGRTLFLHVSGELRFRDSAVPPLKMDEIASGEDFEARKALMTLVEPVEIFYGQPWPVVPPASLTLRVETAEEVRAWTVEETRVDKRSVDPRGTLGVDVVLRERYGNRQVRHFDVALPPALKQGPFRIRASGAMGLDLPAISDTAPAIEDAAQYVALFNRRHRADRLYLQIVSDAPGRVVGDRQLPALPPSVLSVTGRDAAASGAKTVSMGEQVWYETSAEMPGVVGGQQSVFLDIHS